jgi:hypothetical protein
MLFERPLKMRLIGKPGLQRDVSDQPAAAQLLLGKLDPAVDQKRVGRHAEMLLERADQVRRRQLRGLANVLELKQMRAVVANEIRRALQFEIRLAQRLITGPG